MSTDINTDYEDEKPDFIPNVKWEDNFWYFCRSYCRNYEECPDFYQCPTMARWDMTDRREL